MAYVFIDDGYPEAEEYETNYIEFDATDPRKIRAIINQVRDYLKNRKNNRCIKSECFNCSYSFLSA
jgi:transposase